MSALPHEVDRASEALASLNDTERMRAFRVLKRIEAGFGQLADIFRPPNQRDSGDDLARHVLRDHANP